MNKEKYSKILEQYSGYFKKYGIYLLIILFFLTLSLNYLFGQMQKAAVQMDDDSLPVAHIEIEKPAQDDKQEEEQEISNESKLPIIAKSPEPKKPETTKAVSKPAPVTKTPAPVPAPASGDKFKPEWPVEGKVIKNYGLSYSEVFDDYRLYPGIDIETKPGTKITAAFGGKVILVENTKEKEYTVQIDHGQGCFTNYEHLTQVFVKTGQKVKTGEKIGEAGSHLHFGTKISDRWLDPLEHLKK